MKTCKDCGCKVYDGYCTNCDEETFIDQQYDDLDMDKNYSDEFKSKLIEQTYRAEERLKGGE